MVSDALSTMNENTLPITNDEARTSMFAIVLGMLANAKSNFRLLYHDMCTAVSHVHFANQETNLTAATVALSPYSGFEIMNQSHRCWMVHGRGGAALARFWFGSTS